MHIVLIDPSPLARHIVQRLLERRGHTVCTYSHPLAALRSLWQRPPDALIVDVQLPQLDGYALTQLLRAKDPFQTLPIIGLTTRDGMLDRVKGRLAGMNAYLTKPFDPRDLLVTLANL